MTDAYDEAVAAHYAAYRPSLHAMILERVFSGEESFYEGLDVGCGTGRSATALAAFCDHVWGVDPSRAMLEAAAEHERVTYRQGAGASLPLPGDAVDVVTFAGALFYAKSDALVGELRRACRKCAVVVVYDFEVLLGELLAKYGVGAGEADTDYDHRVNFSGTAGLRERLDEAEQVSLEATAAEVAHVLLADAQRHEALSAQYTDPFAALKHNLERTSESQRLEARLYYSRYRLAGA